jgi:hypothetical protein
MNYIQYKSSDIDFCEKNSSDPQSWILESFNAFSSLAFVFVGIHHWMIANLYIRFQSDDSYNQIQKVSMILSCIGLASFYFHATLSVLGSWMDIIFISIIELFLIYQFRICSVRRIILIAMIHVYYSFVNHAIHILCLFSTGLFIAIKGSKKSHVFSSENTKYFYIAIAFWIADFVFCPDDGTFHTHWIFHLVMAYLSHLAISKFQNNNY